MCCYTGVSALACGVSLGSVHYLSTTPATPPTAKHKGGRPKSLSHREVRLLLRQITTLRKESSSFSVSELVRSAGLLGCASMRTFYRTMKANAFSWAVVKRKGVLSAEDKRRRVQWCKAHKSTPKAFWTDKVSFYFDAASFVHKLRPNKEACAPGRRAWLRKDEKLQNVRMLVDLCRPGYCHQKKVLIS